MRRVPRTPPAAVSIVALHAVGAVLTAAAALALIAAALLSTPARSSEGGGAGWDYVRSHPMFVSALAASMNNPPAAWVDNYWSQNNVAAQFTHTGQLLQWEAITPGYAWVAWRKPGPNTPPVDFSYLAGRIGYQIGDEPENLAEIDEYEAYCTALKALDPGALCTVNMVDHAFPFQFAAAAAWADVITVTNYQPDQRSWSARRKVRDAGLGAGIPYGAYMSTQGSPTDLWWNAFSDVTIGAVWLTWFLYQIPAGADPLAQPYQTFFAVTGDFNSPATAQWSVAQEINAALAVYGRAMTQLTSVDVRVATSDNWWLADYGGFDAWSAPAWPFFVQQIPHVTAIDRPDGGDFVFGVFTDAAGAAYVAIFNARHPLGNTPGTTGDATEQVRLTFDLPAGTIIRQLNEGGAIADRAINGNSVLAINIPAGHMRLIKFDDGIPFAGFE